jgi:DNA-binding MarR family transcriptional regulator
MPAEGLPILACACASLRRASRAVSRVYDGWLDGNAQQFGLLYVLDKQRGRPVTQKQIGELLSLDPTTLTRTLAPLAKRKWIRAQPGVDRRERQWSLTDAGRKQLERLYPRWERAQSILRNRFGVERWEPLLEELAVIATAARFRLEDGVKRVTAKPRRMGE